MHQAAHAPEGLLHPVPHGVTQHTHTHPAQTASACGVLERRTLALHPAAARTRLPMAALVLAWCRFWVFYMLYNNWEHKMVGDAGRLSQPWPAWWSNVGLGACLVRSSPATPPRNSRTQGSACPLGIPPDTHPPRGHLQYGLPYVFEKEGLDDPELEGGSHGHGHH